MDNQSLWKKIESFHIGAAGASLSFDQRLARENDWSAEFTDRVIFEFDLHQIVLESAMRRAARPRITSHSNPGRH